MGMLELIGFRSYSSSGSELPEIYGFGVECNKFVAMNVQALYKKILTDCYVRTQGITEEIKPAFWDNCLGSEVNNGLLTQLAYAMTIKGELFLTWNLGVLRKATQEEQVKIKIDYEKQGKSSLGVYISFKNLDLTDILVIYAAMEHASLASLNTMMNLAKAIQFKVSKMRATVGHIDRAEVMNQCAEVANSLRNGRPIAIDGEDEVTTAQLDMDPTEKAVSFLDSKRAFYTGMPKSYITGEQTGGIGSTGEGDTKAVERGLEPYWHSIMQPTIFALFGLKVTFESQDVRQVDTALNAIRTFELVSEKVISLDNQRLIVSQLLGIENDLEGQPAEEPQPEENKPVNEVQA